MGFNFRKTIKIGGVNLNLSKRGLGASVGVKGVRVGVNAKGKRYSALSIPGTGIRYSSTEGRGYDDDAPSTGIFRRFVGSMILIVALLIGIAAVASGFTNGFGNSATIILGVVCFFALWLGSKIHG